MNNITDALLLKNTATRGQVAVTYAIVGLLGGMIFFSR